MPAPPAEKIAVGNLKKVTVQVKAAGTVTDYDDAKKAALEVAMAATAGVAANAVTVTVTAGSVILNFVILTADPAATKATLNTALADTALATAALNDALEGEDVTVEATPTVAVRLASPLPLMSDPTPLPHLVATLADGKHPPSQVVSSSSSDDDGLGAGAIVGIVIGAVVGLLLIGGIIFMVMKNGKNVNPKEHSPA